MTTTTFSDPNTPDMSARNEWRASVYPKAIVFALLAAAVFYVFVADGSKSPHDNPVGGDFPAFYDAGRSVLDSPNPADLYSPDAQQERQDDLVGVGSAPRLSFAYPPQVAVVYAPLAALPYRVAYAVNMTAMFLALIAALMVLAPVIPGLRRWFWMVAMVAVLFVPVMFSIGVGQNATVTMLLFSVMWRSLHDDREVLAGVAVGLMMFKPQYGLPLAGLLLVGRYWRAVAAVAAVAATTVAMNTALFGSHWVSEWIKMASFLTGRDAANRGPFLIDPHGFFRAITGSDAVAVRVAGLAVGFAAAAVLVWMWSQRSLPLDLVMAATSSGLLLVSQRSVFYETGVMLAAALVAWDRGVPGRVVAGAVLAVGSLESAALPADWSPFGFLTPLVFVAVIVFTVGNRNSTAGTGADTPI